MTIKKLYLLGDTSGKPKQVLIELFLIVNMAQLMFVAALSFYKILIVSEGIAIAEICMYRFGILFSIETIKLTCCNFFFCRDYEENRRERDSSPRLAEEEEEN